MVISIAATAISLFLRPIGRLCAVRLKFQLPALWGPYFHHTTGPAEIAVHPLPPSSATFASATRSGIATDLPTLSDPRYATVADEGLVQILQKGASRSAPASTGPPAGRRLG